ncbi:MAG: hypothetical protein NZL89_07310, partial [Leptospiraceae bacterium]|nr:hypothetical protein [Leptospiraceae bacterium]
MLARSFVRILLITRNQQLADHCRRALPKGFNLQKTRNPRFHGEITHNILLFDSAYLLEQSDTALRAAAERYGATQGAVAIGILLDEE